MHTHKHTHKETNKHIAYNHKQTQIQVKTENEQRQMHWMPVYGEEFKLGSLDPCSCQNFNFEANCWKDVEFYC